ncbi:unnamed protein product [Effrenium voratum]|uniref:ferredoxin:thioredoxin reductase n=1 Tax=Effrenium voratum TaxID=2562239 RepID=A0AA36JKW1_9DINO|nr:unnamed protein product [Effrenium voratum]
MQVFVTPGAQPVARRAGAAPGRPKSGTDAPGSQAPGRRIPAILALGIAGFSLVRSSRRTRTQSRAAEKDAEEKSMEPSTKSIETMMKFSNQYAKVTKTKYCTDKSVPAVVIVGLALHKETLGAPLCPCRHYEDKEQEVKNGYWNCPCVPMRERHECHCMLFLKDNSPFANTLPKQLQALADVSLIILRSECAQIDLEEIMKLKDG